MEWSPRSSADEIESGESPQKRHCTVRRSDTFPVQRPTSPLSNLDHDRMNLDSPGNPRPARVPRGTLTKSIGAKASSVRNLFKVEKGRKSTLSGTPESVKVPDEQKLRLRASMLAMLLVHKTDLCVLRGLLEGAPCKEELVEQLLDFFDGHGQTKRLIECLVDVEIQNTVCHTTLFRENSNATKLVGLIFRREGAAFLEATLLPHIKDIVANASAYEVSNLPLLFSLLTGVD